MLAVIIASETVANISVFSPLASLKQVTLKKLRAYVPMFFAKLGSVEEAHTFCEELALKKVTKEGILVLIFG